MKEAAIELMQLLKNNNLITNLILAGGAVRDTLNGLDHRISDYDLYCNIINKIPYLTHNPVERDLIKFLREMNFTVTGEGHSTVAATKIHRIYATKYKGISADLIILKGITPQHYIDLYFDLGICECWLDTEDWDFHMTRRYKTDIADRTITLKVKEDMTTFMVGRALSHHLPKVLKKYPGYKIKLDLPT